MRCALLFVPMLLAGCAQSSSVGPSLARRPIEGRDMAEPQREATPPPPAGAALAGEITGLLDQARAGARAFDALLPRAQTAAAVAGAEGSESWITAQQSLSALEAARASTMAALGRLDALLAERVLARDDAGLAELQAAQQEVAGIAEAQQRRFDALQRQVSR